MRVARGDLNFRCTMAPDRAVDALASCEVERLLATDELRGAMRNGQVLHSLQWVCVIIQCCAIAIVQYDACKGTGFLPLKAYYMIGTATLITAVTSVWNQLIIKGFDVPVNLQNSIMSALP